MARRIWVDDVPLAPQGDSASRAARSPGGSPLLIRRISVQDDAAARLLPGPSATGEVPDPWPLTVPAIADIRARGLTLNTAITVFVGDNGSGKSTLVEALAEAWGIDLRGGHGARRYAPLEYEPSALAAVLTLEYSARGMSLQGSGKGPGFFLRAESIKDVLEEMSSHSRMFKVPGYGDVPLRERSHGEGYRQVLSGRFRGPGLYLLDEPETALTFEATIELVGAMRRVVREGGQVVCATHSPILAALPEAELLELGPHGIRSRSWDELDMVRHWRAFFADPGRYL